MEYYAYDKRTDLIFSFRRFDKYILIQPVNSDKLMKISLEDFDEHFEGISLPIGPMLKIRPIKY